MSNHYTQHEMDVDQHNQVITELPMCSYQRGTTPCLKQNCAILFLSELCQISTSYHNFWQKDGKEAKIMRAALIFHIN